MEGNEARLSVLLLVVRLRRIKVDRVPVPIRVLGRRVTERAGGIEGGQGVHQVGGGGGGSALIWRIGIRGRPLLASGEGGELCRLTVL